MHRTLPALLAATCLLASLAVRASPTAVEYFHAGYGHYFVTASAQEAASLDAAPASGWVRTGQSFSVLDVGAPAASAVCRFWSGQAFYPKSSHFYTPFASECAAVKDNPHWQFEGGAYGMGLADATGACAAGLLPLYRLYNDGRSGAPNHRYTTSSAIRSQMIAQGWTPEGSGIGVIGCVPAPTVEGFTVVAAGDIAECDDTPPSESIAARTAELVSAADALVVTVGDHSRRDPTLAGYLRCFEPTWGKFKSRIRPAPGNHDYDVSFAAGYFDYFGAQAGPDRRGWYSFDYGGWHFISLNSNVDVSAQSEQYRWLANDLAASRSTLCTVAAWHHPRFSSGASHGSNEAMKPFFELLHGAGVEIVLAGDEHVYERFAPQTADGVADPVRGVRHFTVGTGGVPLHKFGVPIANSEFRNDEQWGVLRLTLGAAAYSWQFMPVGGGPPIDAGTTACHP